MKDLEASAERLSKFGKHEGLKETDRKTQDCKGMPEMEHLEPCHLCWLPQGAQGIHWGKEQGKAQGQALAEGKIPGAKSPQLEASWRTL